MHALSQFSFSHGMHNIVRVKESVGYPFLLLSRVDASQVCITEFEELLAVGGSPI